MTRCRVASSNSTRYRAIQFIFTARMRKLILLLSLFAVGYACWFYTSQYSNEPLRVPLLQLDAEEVTSIEISGTNQNFQLIKGENDSWVVSQDQRLLYHREKKVGELLHLLKTTLSDSLMLAPAGGGNIEMILLEVKTAVTSELVSLVFTAEPSTPVMAKLGDPATFLAYPSHLHAWRKEYLRFDSYRERRLLDVSPADVDSIIVYKNDSILWGINTGDLRQSAARLIVPEAASYADHFDEISFRDREYATIKLFVGNQPKQITVYRDSLWPRPFVLVGEDYPRRFLGYDALR